MQISLLNKPYPIQIHRKKEDCHYKPQFYDDKYAFPAYKFYTVPDTIKFGQNIPTTSQCYKMLDNSQIELLRNQAKLKLKFHQIYSSDTGLSILENVTNEILSRFKENRLVGIGRTPIALLEMAKNKQNGINQYCFAAFSEGRSLNSINTKIWQINKSRPNAEQLCCYRKYLQTLELNPDAIIQKAQTGEKTIFIDFCESSKGMRNFLNIIKDWSLEQDNYESLKKSAIAVPIHYPLETKHLSEKAEYIINGENKVLNIFEEFNSSPINLNTFDPKKLLLDVVNQKCNVTYEKSFPYYKWNRMTVTPGPDEADKLNSDLARFIIIDYLARKNILK